MLKLWAIGPDKRLLLAYNPTVFEYKMVIHTNKMTTSNLQCTTAISSKKHQNAKKTTENHRKHPIDDKNNPKNSTRLASVLGKRHTTHTLSYRVCNCPIKLLSNRQHDAKHRGSMKESHLTYIF